MLSFTFSSEFNTPDVKAVVRNDGTVNINCHYQTFSGQDLLKFARFITTLSSISDDVLTRQAYEDTAAALYLLDEKCTELS